MPDRTHIGVFCGSSRGARPAYLEAARSLGDLLAHRGLGLVYGGGRVGLMGALADAALAAGGRVVGVIPEPLALKEIAHDGLTELHVVPGMHERKALMARSSSAFLTMPGGLGTFEEFFEILTWAVLGLHAKPMGLLDVDGYFDPLLAMLARATAEGFIKPDHLGFLHVSDDAAELVDRLLAPISPPTGPKWIDLDQT